MEKNNATSMIVRLLRYLVVITVVLGGIAVALFVALTKPLDTTAYKKSDFYARTMLAISKLPKDKESGTDTVQAGWARINLLPSFSTPIAIDAERGGKHFEGVRDSVYINAFVFKQGDTKVAYISADLLIIPPSVVQILDTMLLGYGFDNTNIYYTATHTHSSIGGWHSSVVGELFAGKFDNRIPSHLARCIEQAVLQAEKNCTVSRFGYAEIPTSKLVVNRLVGDRGKIDSLIRILKIENEKFGSSSIITYSAHCTVFHEHYMKISGDWAGELRDRLLRDSVCNFACFSAGAVGSHGPFPYSTKQEVQLDYLAAGVYNSVKNNYSIIKTDYLFRLEMSRTPIYLREPNVRVTDKRVVRPYLFYRLAGNETVYINRLRLGETNWIGLPCDFSGELIHNLGRSDVNITSFNGGFIGYITDDRWYNENTYETWTMGWFGPENGGYFSEVIDSLIY